MTQPIHNHSQSVISSEEQMQAFLRHPAVRAKLLPYQLLQDSLTRPTRLTRLINWLAKIFFSTPIPQIGSAGYLRDRLMALRIHVNGPENPLSPEEEKWFKRYKDDPMARFVLQPDQTAFFVQQVADALEARLEVVQADDFPEDRVIQTGDWKGKRRVMGHLIHLTHPSLSVEQGQKIDNEIRLRYKRSSLEKMQLIAASGLHWMVSLGAIPLTMEKIGISPDSYLGNVGMMMAMRPVLMSAPHYLAENADFLPVKATLFGTDMVFLYKAFNTARSFVAGEAAGKDIGVLGAIQLYSGVNVLMSYCPMKKVAGAVSKLAFVLVAGYTGYKVSLGVIAGVSSLMESTYDLSLKTISGVSFLMQSIRNLFSNSTASS